MNLRRMVARSISEAVSWAGVFSAPRPGLRVLMYHAIGTPALGDGLGYFTLSPERFRAHMDRLASDYAGRVLPLVPGGAVSPASRLAISFDDGYLDNLLVAAPLLAERKLPFTVFVTANFVREGRPGFLTPSALRELVAVPGARIGAHGASHVALTECDDALLREELVSSRRYLEDVLGAPVDTMAYPYGAANRRVRAAVAEAGYRLAATSHANVNDAARDPLLLGRTEILSVDTVRVLDQKLKGNWDWYRWRNPDPALS